MIEPGSPALQVDSLPLSHQRSYVYIYVYIHTHIVFFIHSSVDRYLYLAHYSAAMNIEVHVSFLIRVFFVSELYLEVGFLDHMV